LTATNTFFHVGILVDDLELAIERFSNVLNVNFLEPTVAHVDYLEEPGRMEPFDLRISYSSDGPPRYELMEAQGDGIYGLRQGQGVHHIGIWEPDCERKLEHFVGRHGLQKEGVMYTPDKRIIVAYFHPDDMHGTRIEIVDEGRRQQMERWFDGAPWVD
jgi:catechol 2,3-dioxygenase-like lactoylglutathione lyase family enzyme